MLAHLKNYGVTFWTNLTASKVTIAYGLMTVIYGFIQIVLLFDSFSINHDTSESLLALMRHFNFSDKMYFDLRAPLPGQSSPVLDQCSSIKQLVLLNRGDCITIWPPAAVDAQQALISSGQLTGKLNMADLKPKAPITIVNPMPNMPNAPKIVNVSPECGMALQWPTQKLRRNRREDVSFLCYQFWVMALSLAAIYSHSIPHIIASFITHILSAFWSIYQLYTFTTFQSEATALLFSSATTGACVTTVGGQNLLSDYLSERHNIEIGISVLNFTTLFLSGFLTWKLYILFGWSMFKKMGASILINRLYRIALATFISIHLSLFFFMAILTLWLDQLLKGFMGGSEAKHGPIYLALSFASAFFLPAWAFLAWYGIRKERTRFILGFFGSSVILMAGTWGMLGSDTFRATCLHWNFFLAMTVIAFCGTTTTLVLGITCRLGFGKGLPDYLDAQDPAGEDTFRPAPDTYADGHVIAFPGEKATVSRSGTGKSNMSGSFFEDEEKIGFPGEAPRSLSRQNTFDSFSFDQRPLQISEPPSIYDPPRRSPTATSPVRQLTPQRSIGHAQKASLNPFESELDRTETISSFGPRGDVGFDRNDTISSFGPRGDVGLGRNDTISSFAAGVDEYGPRNERLAPSSSFGSVKGGSRTAQLARNGSAGSNQRERVRLDLDEEMGGRF
jgi:hypothetical protein